MHVQERPLGGVARHVRVQVAHVREARLDDLIRWRLPVAVVVVGDQQLEIQPPRADLRAARLEVIVRDEGQPLDEPIVEAVEVFQDRFGFFGGRYGTDLIHLERALVIPTTELNRGCSAPQTAHGRRAGLPTASRR